MTQDFVALTPKMPDVPTLLAGLYAGGPDLRVGSVSEGAAIQLHASDGRPLLTLEVPLFLQVPSEANRLLGADVSVGEPVWWTEVRASTAAGESGRLAASVAGRLTAVLGGTTWPRGDMQTDVVTVSPSDGEASDPSHPAAVDLLTDRAAAVFQDRPVVAATTWLADLLRTAAGMDREVQIVTPPGTRLTLPTRSLCAALPARWVVRDPDNGYWDGLTGAVLHWRDGHFLPALADDGNPQLAEAFASPTAFSSPKDECQLLLTVRTAQQATEQLLLGRALEACWQILTGAPPAGWSTSEPVNLPWSPRQLTELARTRAQKGAPTWLVAVGSPDRPAIATLRIGHTPAGIEEHITLALGYTADQPPPLNALPALAETLATRHHMSSMLVHLRQARADLTTPARREAPPVPIAFTLGPEAVAAVGRLRAENAPGVRPTRLGPAARSALHYPLGDGTDSMAWQRLKELRDHLKAR